MALRRAFSLLATPSFARATPVYRLVPLVSFVPLASLLLARALSITPSPSRDA
jgi:hypothetical protein